MLGVSAMLGGDGGGAAAEGRDGGGCGGGGGDGAGVAGTSSGGFSEEDKLRMEESERNSGGNRWPRQETLALLKIRSEMDVAFRDSSLKGPLWDEVSRKLAELGFQRSAKKCKEKFENVYKYHRRTKEGRSSKSDGKTYRFFDQLEALENQSPAAPPPPLPPPPRPQSQPVTSATPVAVAMPAATTTHQATHSHPPVVTHVFTVPSMSSLNPTAIVSQSPMSINPNPPPSLPPPVVASPISFSYQTAINQLPTSHSHIKMPDVGSISTSSSTSSDEEAERRGRRKRKWGDFLQRLMSEVVEKQEEMQKKFLETLDRRERERVAREEAWRAQEMARMNREHELLVHERSVAAAKDAAVIQFLQKISDGQGQQHPIPNAPQMQMQMPPESNPAPPQQPTPQPPPQPQPQPPAAPRQTVLHPPPLQQQVLQPTPPPQPLQLQVQTPVKGMEIMKADNGGGGGGGGGGEGGYTTPTSSSRWPKAEVEALIRLRTNMDTKYQENVPKGPLWEEISAAMRRIGYDRNAKRCKEKWENINKYFKKVKESNKKRPEDSKTCPYFQQLDELYKEKAKNENNTNISPQNFNVGSINAFSMKPAAESVPGVAPMMVQPEQQYRPNEDDDSQNMEGDDGEEEEEDDEDEDEAGGYEVVPNKAASNSVGTTA